MQMISIALSEPEYCTVQGLLKIRKCVRSMTGEEKRVYECQYLNDEDIIESFRPHFCHDCAVYVDEPDINSGDCPCGLDINDINCYRSYIYDRLKEICIEEDFMLRIRLGSRWADDYDSFLRGIYI